uniref:aldolase/citrate lyase family protein n=1 Tax=Pseudonocardia sp. TaxID=60912 RepID=UPI002626162C
AAARGAVASARHPPAAHRSSGPPRVGPRPAHPEPTCILMIETVAAVAALPDILAEPGIDGIFVGPSDLALSAGLPLSAQDGDPAFESLLREIVGPCREAGLPVGIYCASAAHVHRFRTVGMTFTALLSEAAMLRAAATAYLTAARHDPAPPDPS